MGGRTGRAHRLLWLQPRRRREWGLQTKDASDDGDMVDLDMLEDWQVEHWEALDMTPLEDQLPPSGHSVPSG